MATNIITLAGKEGIGLLLPPILATTWPSFAANTSDLLVETGPWLYILYRVGMQNVSQEMK